MFHILLPRQDAHSDSRGNTAHRSESSFFIVFHFLSKFVNRLLQICEEFPGVSPVHLRMMELE